MSASQIVVSVKPSPAGLQELLAELQSITPTEMERRLDREYQAATSGAGGRAVIFGAGQLGRFVLPGLRRTGIEPLAFCDNNPGVWGTLIDSVPVLSPADAVSRYGDRAFFLTAIYNAAKVRQQLQRMGCTRIVSYPLFFHKHGRHWTDERLDLPSRVLDQAADMQRAYPLLADDESRIEFLAQIRWRCLLDDAELPGPHPAEEAPFPSDLVRLLDNEVYVDCGAFDGDSVRHYLARVGSRFAGIYAFEPDAANLVRMTETIARLAPATRDRIRLAPYALSREDGFARFEAEGSAGSRVISSPGSVEVPCRSLDSYFGEDIAPTFIKMDIEGAEIDAIPGAAKTIARCRPVMAVCAYHRPSDLWQIPILLHQAWSGYRIFLRRYAEDCWETMYYAIPPERLAETGGQ
jgi:FkbM family methyltransferase